MQTLTPVELEDILVGCTILGTGGGGSLSEGLRVVKTLVDQGKRFTLAKIEDLPPEAPIGSPYYCGSVPPEGSGHPSDRVALMAFEALESYLKRPFAGVIAAELGGFATAGALAVAAEKGLPLLDADAAGRAVPDLQCSIFYVKGLSITPMAVATPMGDSMIISHVKDDQRSEEIIRQIAVVSGNMVGVCDHPASVQQLQEAAILNTISQAGNLGKARREAIAAGKSPITAVAEAGHGFIRFQGTVENHVWEIKSGFTVGEIELVGIEHYAGEKYRIHYKNENIIAWRDGEVDMTVPDLICVLDNETGMPITNPNCDPGKTVAVIGLPAPEKWRTPEGLAVFGPGFFGYDEEYIPVERRIV